MLRRMIDPLTPLRRGDAKDSTVVTTITSLSRGILPGNVWKC